MAVVLLLVIILVSVHACVAMFSPAMAGMGIVSDEDVEFSTRIYSEWETDLAIFVRDSNITEEFPPPAHITSQPGVNGEVVYPLYPYSPPPPFYEFRFEVGMISHDPMELISYLTAVHGERFSEDSYNPMTRNDLEAILAEIFEEQYGISPGEFDDLITTEEETRFRRERRFEQTGTQPVIIDIAPDGSPIWGAEPIYGYVYHDIYYQFWILTVNLTSRSLSDVLRSRMTEDEEMHFKQVPMPQKETPDLDEWRKYKAEISLPNTEFPHLEVFGADNDVDAVNQANELASEQEGAYLLEVHELNDNYDSIREIDLRNHDPEVRRFMDVDIIDFLGQIAEKTIIHYPGDFKIDVDALWKAALAENPEEKRLMWHCCSYGTHILDEQDVFIKDTGAYGTWVNYRPNDEDMIGYVIEVTGYEDETVIGNVYDVGNYAQHAFYVHENALALDSLSLTYSNDWGINAGKTITVPRYEYDNDSNRLMCESGNVVKIQYHPSESTKKMADLLKAEKIKHMAMPIGDTQEHLEKLGKKLAELHGEPEPTQQEQQDNLRIYHADFSDPERKEIIAALDDVDALRQANEICAEVTGLTLVEFNEVYENGNMREVPLKMQESEIMPDQTITLTERNEFGYVYEEMLPLNQDRALELFMQDCAVYLLYNDDTESAVHDSSEITNHDGIFGIERKDWEKSNAFKELIAEKESAKNPAQQAAEKQAEAPRKEPTAKKPAKPKRRNRGEDR